MSKFNDAIFLNQIECGIGTISYEEPDNLLLQQLMESLEEAIKKTTPKNVLDVLSSI